MHPRENGFVLVIGLALLTIATGMVVAGMSLGRYQERQAGHYLRTNNAQLGADEAFLHLLRGDTQWARDIRQYVNDQLMANAENGTTWKPGVDDMSTTPWRDRNALSPSQYTRPMVESVEKLDEDTVRVTFSGSNWVDGNDQNVGFSSFQAEFNVGGGDEAGGAYREVLLGCEGVNTLGSGVIDSYDSRDGTYGEDGNANKSNATIKSSYKGDRFWEGDIVLSSGQPVYGDVESAGRIIVGNSGTLHGDLNADGDIVVLNGGADIQGDVSSRGSVEMVKGGNVSGNIRANGDVTIHRGGARVGGDISSRGAVTLKKGGTVGGSILASLDVTIHGGGANILGNVASRQTVRLTSSGRIQGNVESNTEIVTGKWSSRIEGNATAPKVHTTVHKRDVANQVGGTINRVSSDVAEAPEASKVEVEQQSCDAFTSTTNKGATIGDLTDALSPYASSGRLAIGGGNQTYTLTPNGLQVPSDRHHNSVHHPERYKVSRGVALDGIFPEPTNVLVLDSFLLGGSANFVVDGGDMTLYVKGGIGIGGGATFNVAEGSSLKIVTEGRFNLGSNLNVASDSPTDDDGNPILSLYSTYDDNGVNGWNAGVNISGRSAFKGTIFAPYSTVNVAAGGGLYGAVKGRRVEVRGGAGIHYDEALMESTVGTGGGGGGENGEGDWTLKGLSSGADD
ncbi:polymer-forming cytoskeletal protein [Chromohalobacter sp. 48-RD10]|uniref:polymer-forming cytoskeletal protein n=1 Tax=Chromohalobacter sp. 48-RD10 TaxID=2994063 RepID=UPI0024685CEF|nr:polymer-forming cytoskeletal protein [Chromohalobacter sp. 48-RD10]